LPPLVLDDEPVVDGVDVLPVPELMPADGLFVPKLLVLLAPE
jgi:hypothetical protein